MRRILAALAIGLVLTFGFATRAWAPKMIRRGVGSPCRIYPAKLQGACRRSYAAFKRCPRIKNVRAPRRCMAKARRGWAKIRDAHFAKVQRKFTALRLRMRKGMQKPKARVALKNLIKDVEAQREQLRNRRAVAQTSFQNFDQKANQLFNMLSSVLKTMKEMRQGAIRNIR